MLSMCLDKTYNSDFNIVSIKLDRVLTNSKLARAFLELLNDTQNKLITE